MSKAIREKLAGVFIPVITPFKNQEIDFDALASNIRKTSESKIKGYMPLGSNGEFAHMSDEEQIKVYKTIKENANSSKVFMTGIARQSAYNTVEFGKRIEEIGTDFVSVLCPSYYAGKMDDTALIKYFTYVADRLSVPVLTYNCPKFAAGVTISENVIKEIADHPNIMGMKDTSSEDITKYCKAAEGKDFYIVAGSITKFLTGLKNGGAGGVLSLANYQPDLCAEIQELFEAGKVKEAEELSDALIKCNKAGAGKYGPAGVKVGCDIYGLRGGEVRLPLFDCTDDVRENIKQTFIDAGFLK